MSLIVRLLHLSQQSETTLVVLLGAVSIKNILILIDKYSIAVLCVIVLTTTSVPVFADSAADMARKLQNPLANIRAVMTDNAIGFDTGNTNDTSYGFQIQPVYAMDQPDKGFTFLPRAVIPIMGLEPGTDAPPVGQPNPNANKNVWGLGDSIIQTFFAPYTDSSWKWGIGPQVSIPTATDKQLQGPGWGAGIVGVMTGDITSALSFSGIIANHWGDNGKFNTMTIQPMFFYNFPNRSGTSIAYNAVISADWKASSSNRWTVPLGFSYGKTWDLGQGRGFDLLLGPYYNIERPQGAARWQLRFGLSWLLP